MLLISDIECVCVCAHVCIHTKAKISFLGEILGGFGSGETCCVEGKTHSASVDHYWNWCSWPPLSTLMPARVIGTQAEPQPPKRYPEPSTPILACPRSFLGSSLLPSLAQNLAIWRVNGSTENGLMRNMNVPTLGPTCQPLMELQWPLWFQWRCYWTQAWDENSGISFSIICSRPTVGKVLWYYALVIEEKIGIQLLSCLRPHGSWVEMWFQSRPLWLQGLTQSFI